jgi:hypothetical protein
MTPDRDAPPITDEMRAAAHEHPNSWLFVIDPAFDPAGDVPEWGVVGAYPVNADGGIDEPFHPRPGYRPSPRARGWPEPSTELERVVQLVRAGHREATDLTAAVLAADLLIYAGADAGPELAVIGFPDRATGQVVVPACTTASRVPTEWPAWRAVRGRDLVPLLDGHPLAIDPGRPTGVLLPAALLTGPAPATTPAAGPASAPSAPADPAAEPDIDPEPGTASDTASDTGADTGGDTADGAGGRGLASGR